MTKTLTRSGRMTRRGAKGWIGWRATKPALPHRRGGPPSARTVTSFASGIGLGLLLSRFDKRRRHMAVDRTLAAGRDVAEEAARKADYTAGKAKGVAHAAASVVRSDREYDDTTLARKVESELFRPSDVPKGKISVSAANGVVELRGQLDDAQQIESLAKSAERIEGVKAVRNLLHTPSGNGEAERTQTT